MQFHAQSFPFHPYPNDQHTTPKTMVNMENHLKAAPLKVETKTPDSIDTKPGEFLLIHDPDTSSTSSPLVLPVIARRNEITQQHIYTPDVKVTCSAVGRVAGELAAMHQEHVTFSNNACPEARRK